MAQQSDTLLTNLSRQLADLVSRSASGVVAVAGRRRLTSSGFVWRPGIVVTASDALERDEEISVLTADKRADAILAGRDPSTDIAVLRAVEAEHPMPAAAPGEVVPGELVLVIGRHSQGPLSALGMIAVAGGAWQSLRGGRIDRLIRLDRGIGPRHDGGAVINADGRLIGMAVPGPHRVGLVIPLETIERVAEQLLSRGRVSRGYLGIGLQPVRLDEALVKSASLSTPKGLIVVSIDPRGPAQGAGMLIGDIITAWNGDAVSSVREIFNRLGSEPAGKQVTLTIIRAGQVTSVRVALSERAAP